jgi:hypothetical protein
MDTTLLSRLAGKISEHLSRLLPPEQEGITGKEG